MVYEIEEVECRMTDMEERDRSELNGGGGSGSIGNRSVRGSLFNSPKDFPMINPSNKINES